MTTILIGYARCSTDKQDLAAQQAALERLGVAPERIYTDRGLSGTNRSRPQGSRIKPVDPYDTSLGGSEVSSFAQPSRVREPQSLRSQLQA
jgi:hypothetical protein